MVHSTRNTPGTMTCFCEPNSERSRWPPPNIGKEKKENDWFERLKIPRRLRHTATSATAAEQWSSRSPAWVQRPTEVEEGGG